MPIEFLQKETKFGARDYLARIDLDTVPRGATLIEFDVLPLVYMQKVHGVRPDINILVPHGRLNRAFLESAAGPVFTTQKSLPLSLDAELVGDGLVREIRLLEQTFGTESNSPNR